MTESVVTRDCAGQLTRLFITSLVIIGLDCTAQYQPTRVVSTRYGRLQGIILPATSPLTPVELYLGVPYATAPVGVNRWGPTRNPTPWMGVKVVDHFGPACPQSFPLVHPNTTQGFQSHSKSLRNKRIEILLNNQSEDCLYLNIYAPTKGRPGLTEKFPVMVLIHGESYEFGSGQLYDGSVIASHSRIIFVTLDFRLGFLGFLNLGHWSKGKGRLSNYGLMDQVAALHWVRQNIAEFNGDPQRITLVGHRYGASFIHFLMKSPAVVSGLFHRAILLSGSSQAPWALSPDAESIAQQFSAAAGCSGSNSSSASAASIDPTLACLRNTPLEVLQQAALGIPRRVFVPDFGPSVDGVVISHRPSAEENLRGYDFITGVTGYEAREFPSDGGRELLETLVGETYRFHQVEILLTLLNEYTDWQEGRLSVQEALSDGLFVAPAIAMADSLIHKHAAGNRGYFYVMDPSLVQQMAGEWDFELSLLLGSPLQNTKHHDGEYMYSKQDVILCEAMMNLFTNFAQSGNSNPNEGSLSETFLISRERNYFKGLVWQTYQKSGRNFLQMGLQPRLGHNFRWHRLSIWLQLIPELHRSGQQNILQGHGRLAEDRGNKPFEETSCATPATALSRSSNSSTPASVREHETYSTALSVTIVVGCSLLIVNVLAFAGIYYWRDQRHKRAVLTEDGVPDFNTRDCARSSYEMRPNGHPPDPTIFYTSTGSQTLRNYGKAPQLGSSSEQHLVRQSAARNVLFDTSVAIPPDKTFIVSDAMMI